jgi:hypothetical protein
LGAGLGLTKLYKKTIIYTIGPHIKPVAIKKVDPNTLSVIVYDTPKYSNTCNPVNSIANIIVATEP